MSIILFPEMFYKSIDKFDMNIDAASFQLLQLAIPIAIEETPVRIKLIRIHLVLLIPAIPMIEVAIPATINEHPAAKIRL